MREKSDFANCIYFNSDKKKFIVRINNKDKKRFNTIIDAVDWRNKNINK